MSARTRYLVFVAIHVTIGLWGILEIAEYATRQQDIICQEGC